MNKQYSKIVLAIDIDDTIEHLLPAWVEWLNERHHLNVDYTQIKQWDMKLAFPSLSEEEIYEPLIYDVFWQKVQPREDALTYVKKLYDDGFDIYLCSSSHYKTITPKFEYVIEKYYPYLTWDKVIITSKKQLIRCDIMVDDAFQNLLGGDYERILLDAPYNRGQDAWAFSIRRAKNWEEIYNIIIYSANALIKRRKK